MRGIAPALFFLEADDLGVGYKDVNFDFSHAGSREFVLDVTIAGAFITVGLRF